MIHEWKLKMKWSLPSGKWLLASVVVLYSWIAEIPSLKMLQLKQQPMMPLSCANTVWGVHRSTCAILHTKCTYIYPQTSSVVTTTTATSCSTVHVRVVMWSHTWMCYHNSYATMASLTSVLFKGCLHTAIRSMTLSFPPLIYSWCHT